jgi:hypothetical protein
VNEELNVSIDEKAVNYQINLSNTFQSTCLIDSQRIQFEVYGLNLCCSGKSNKEKGNESRSFPSSRFAATKEMNTYLDKKSVNYRKNSSNTLQSTCLIDPQRI